MLRQPATHHRSWITHASVARTCDGSLLSTGAASRQVEANRARRTSTRHLSSDVVALDTQPDRFSSVLPGRGGTVSHGPRCRAESLEQRQPNPFVSSYLGRCRHMITSERRHQRPTQSYPDASVSQQRELQQRQLYASRRRSQCRRG